MLIVPAQAQVSIHAPTGGATTKEYVDRKDATFQFTRPRGARPEEGGDLRLGGDVSIHAPTGGATVQTVEQTPVAEFQFTRPRGARLNFAMASVPADTFQFTRPRGARPSSAPRSIPRSRFNSRAHGGRDTVGAAVPAARKVSIHAPTGGATGAPPRGTRRRAVSIHAPTGGATHAVGAQEESERFNSRAHGGRDTRRGCPDPRPRVSIHAPTGGATWYNPSGIARQRFNSRAHGGRDRAPSRGCAKEKFQFTRPRGARPTITVLLSRLGVSIHAPTGGATPPCPTDCGSSSFNSRAHGGRDLTQTGFTPAGVVSIHAPTGGATRARAGGSATTPFQFTRPRGARLQMVDNLAHALRFNSRAHGGRDCSPSPASRTRTRFNSRAHGGRDGDGVGLGDLGRVSIHAPTGGATR